MKPALALVLCLIAGAAQAQALRTPVAPTPSLPAAHTAANPADLAALQQQLAELKTRQATLEQQIVRIRACNKLLQTKLYMLAEGVTQKSDSTIASAQALPTPACEAVP